MQLITTQQITDIILKTIEECRSFMVPGLENDIDVAVLADDKGVTVLTDIISSISFRFNERGDLHYRGPVMIFGKECIKSVLIDVENRDEIIRSIVEGLYRHCFYIANLKY